MFRNYLFYLNTAVLIQERKTNALKGNIVTINRAWNRCPSLRTQWLKITGSFMQQQRQYDLIMWGIIFSLWVNLKLALWCVNTPHVAVTIAGWHIHASVSRSPRGHGSVAPDKRHCRQWISSLFCGFLPNPYPWPVPLTYQPRICKDGYIFSLMSLRYAVCSTRCGSIIGRCFGACQRSSCAEERRPQ